MKSHELINWVNNTVTTLPITKELFFQQLWKEGRLIYSDSPDLVDSIDEVNAKIICTALQKGISSVIVLPDDTIHRGALMFGTALLKSAVECIEHQEENHRVLYFGTSIGFKYSLSKTAVKNLPLDSVFTYTQVAGKYDRFKNYKRSDTMSDFLPEVICIYHPDNPEEFVQIYNPDWIAIDCGKDIEIDWLNGLLQYCKKKGKPVIAWSQNGFSNIVELFEKYDGKVYYVPPKNRNTIQKNIGQLLIDTEPCHLQPILFSHNKVREIDFKLYNSKGILRSLNEPNLSTLKKDALKTCWIFLRAVERLSIPVSIYNAEASVFRYVYSFDSMTSTLRRYSELISKDNSIFSQKIEQFSSILNGILADFENSQPPYWSALSNYCIDSPPEGSIRVLVFPKRHQKQIFAYTLLSKFNIREDELFDDCRTMLRTLKEIANPSHADNDIYSNHIIIPLVVGLPDFYNRHMFYEVINKWHTEVLIYPHQIGILKAILKSFSEVEQQQLKRSINTLRILSNRHDNIQFPSINERYFLCDKFIEAEIELDNISHNTSDESDKLIDIGDLHTELSQLLETGDRDEEDSEYLMSINVATSEEEKRDEGLLIEKAIEIIFHGNCRLVVGGNEQVSIVKQGKTDKIYVGALRVDDKVILIENQSRQSLYDLILARVHNHPSLEIHLGMLKKWKEDFYLGYTKWKTENPNNGLWNFLQMLQVNGSRITTALTVNNWVNGYVMRPQDEEDLRRIGEILNLKFLKENYNKVNNAASRIVGIHIRLSRKLNNWIESKASDYQKDDAELIDDELGLTFGELRGSIKVLRVKSIREINTPTLRTHLGRLERVD